MKHKPLVFGGIFGLLAPIIGLFSGLQVSTFLGNLFMLPFLFVSEMIDKPFGEFPAYIVVLCFVLSVVFWAGIFLLLSKIIRNFRKN